MESFDTHFQRLFRFLDRMSGDAELAADLAQETFIRLYRRGALPDDTGAWLITVALNLFRNARTTHSRHRRLLTVERGQGAHSDAPPSPAQAAESANARTAARAAIDRLQARERSLLLLHAEGYSYREIAAALDLNPASVGTLLVRARTAFRDAYEAAGDPR